jgi:sulfur carrier protein ThiS
MKVKVYAPVGFQSQKFKRKIELELSQESSVEDVLQLLNIENSVEYSTILLNGKIAEKNMILKENDIIYIFPVINGG